MQEFIDKIWRNFSEFYASLDSEKKIGLIGTTVVIFGVLIGIGSWATKTRYAVLYKDLNTEDAKAIVRFMDERNYKNRMMDDDGKTIKVPEEMVDSLRMEIATLGINFSGTVGYEVFDNQSFGTTSFVQRVNKQRALEGELIKTIMHLRGVKRARVHLSIPESSPFVSNKKPPGASVVVELDHGVTLTKNEIAGIGQLVSSAVDGMRTENVVILDSRGKKLSDNHGDSMTANTANRMALEQKLNKDYENKIEEILGKVVGDGKVIAKVAVKLDFTESVETETSYDGENAATLSEVNNVQKLNGSRPSPQGIPGARSNLPGETPQPGIPETRNNVDKSLTTKNYNVPTKVKKSKKPTATVKNMSVAVMIDGKRVQFTKEDGTVGNRYEEWSEADLANFSAIVAGTIGISERRGDQLTIKNMEFAQQDMEAIEAMMREKENRELIKNVAKYFSIGFVISLFFFLVVRPFIQWITDNTVESVEDFLPKTLEELEKVQTNQKLPGLEDALPTIEEKLNPEKIEGNMLREKIITLVEQNPAKAAQVIHDMIHATESNKEIA